ncbi:geranylgeranyl pyrophosphate synthase [Clostridia bacterium]|nr:geranylgeranyl pyrophosphate synthase [Clostridia bacterium]
MIDSLAKASRETAALVDKALRSAPPAIRDMTARLAEGKGKAIRARLLLACSLDADGNIPPLAVRAAAAAELFHLATLVHDDVIDDAETRRGQPALHRDFGRKQAVICGDYILCMAMLTLSEGDKPDTENAEALLPSFTRALSGVCLGELKQHQNHRNLDLTVLNYLRIISGKTSALFYVSAYAGAVIGRGTPSEQRRLARFGKYFGMIFQISDDCKDYELSASAAGKPVGKDIAEGVVTLPLILSIAREPGLRRLAAEAFEDTALAKKLVGRVQTDDARKLAAKYAEKARVCIKDFVPHKRGALEEILEALN